MTIRTLSIGVALALLSLFSLTMFAGTTSVKGDSQLFAAFTYNPCVMCAAPGDVVFFNANTSVSLTGTIVSYTWNFGDGSPTVKTNSSNLTHDFWLALPGKWQVSLTVQDSNGRTDTISQLVVFTVAPSFTVQPDHPRTGQPVVFNATTTRVYQNTTGHPVGFIWNFGNGINGTGALAINRYQTPGIFRVLLTVTTGQGDPTVSRILIVGPPPQAGQQVQVFFDKINITLFATLASNSTTHTITGTISVVATNTTTGTIIFTKTLNITINTAPDNHPRQFLAVISSTSPVIAVSCAIDPTTIQLSCFASRDPDVRGGGTVDIIDIGMATYDFGAVKGSARYNPAVDLDGNGTIDIVDIGIMSADYGAPIF